ncbi:MAG: class I SAM-dependent methyltransferase [Bacteroidota bacterium]
MEHFDKKAQSWDNDIIKVERAISFAKEIIDFINPEKSMNALEFGSGTGLLSFQLKDNFNTITLVDTSEGMIKVLNEKIAINNIKKFYPIHTNLLEEKIDTGDFDVVYTSMTLHHIIDLNKISKIFNSLLKTNGYLCIADLVKEDGSFHPPSHNFEGHNGFDKEELSSLLVANGFEILYYNISYVIEKVVGDSIKKYPLFLMICKKLH